MPDGLWDVTECSGTECDDLGMLKVLRYGKIFRIMKLLRFARILRLFKLFKLSRLRMVMESMQMSGHMNPALMRLFELAIYLALTWHFIACVS
jgi:hypothetical protein